MNEDKQAINSVVSYSDYKKFQNILTDKPSLIKDSINPINFFLPTAKKVEFFDFDDFSKSIFNLRAVKLPYFNIVDSEIEKFYRFEEYTKRDEVNNIALWILSAINYCSDSKLRLGKELEINQENNPRDGRLDVVAVRDLKTLVIETKTDTRTLLNENRFTIQINAYTSECLKYTQEYIKSNELLVLLAIGGEETDIYPIDHEDCVTGIVGNISKIFYEKVAENNIKFVSANALWSIVTYKYITNKSIDIFKFLNLIFSDKESIGLLSGGVVKNIKNRLVLEKINLDLL